MNNSLAKPYVNIFDVCGTLYSINTTFEFIVFYHKTKRNYFNWLYSKIIISKIGKLISVVCRISLREKLLVTLKGENQNELYRISKLFYEDILIQKKNMKIFSIFEELDNKVLVSASIDPVIKVISEHLECDYYSSSLEYINNKSTGILKFDLKGNKASCLQNNIKTVVTDNLDDIDIIKLATKSFLVSPNLKRKKKWKKLQASIFKTNNTEIISLKGI